MALPRNPSQAVDREAIQAISDRTGIAPHDLEAVIMKESGGNPYRQGGAGGLYCGLIQMGPSERRQYGMMPGMSSMEQVEPIARYLQDRAAGVGMTTQGMNLSQLYATVLCGNPRASTGQQDAFGTSVDGAIGGLQSYSNSVAGLYGGGGMNSRLGSDAGFGADFGVQTAGLGGGAAHGHGNARGREPATPSGGTVWGGMSF